MKPLRVVAGLATIVATYVSVGYGTPMLSKQTCIDRTAAYLRQNPIRGRDFGGEWIAADPAEVSARVTGPFEVETDYTTPNDIHLDVHTHRCSTLPWRISLGSRETVTLL